MNKSFRLLIFIIFYFICAGCGNISYKFKISPLEPYRVVKDTTVRVARELNIREIPNGEIIGKTMKNEEFLLVGRRGNWLKVQNDDFPKGYIWGAGLGYEKVNMFSLSTWYDIHAKGFFSFKQYLNFLGKENQVSDYFNLKKYSFYELGFGFSKEIVMDQNGKTETRTIPKGVDIIVNDQALVEEIHLDLKSKIYLITEIETLLKVKMGKPAIRDKTHLAWTDIFGLSEIQLLRSEFESEYFNQIVLIR